MNTAIADLRREYTRQGLLKQDVDSDPFRQFHRWFEQALAAELPEPNAMTIASATPDGRPSARMVLLKNLDDQGFVFYTNYESHKGQELLANPWASLVFWWAELERQVRVEGRVEQVSAAESDAYFHSRPRSSQLGAWASNQSRIVDDRADLEQRLAELEAQYGEDQPIPRPPHWGGFRVVPEVIEFWQGRPNRLHDRIVYRHKAGAWTLARLAP
ncbi:pyridoxamine 5'-phosphate oxidase [Geitlerinema sp. PCC 7407]|uniref:pyridoxamine 5'-phosphate oxidase n=1 Tax=Geitlerinema sp. PCC 7407 TaxID=1173025 RepID=UPI00029FA34B|nr:pyridoxamine 5'-phosphate oxidase [Geitlerinema sp. PCC 7407]AFY67766.1 Pyridoxamine 5'-phosphate oxidase [Geitlerinema sp. PCC 7407]